MAGQQQKNRFLEVLTGLARSAGKGHPHKTPRAMETLA